MSRAAPPWTALRHPILVAQPLPGIGDMVWHVPHIRAIAAFAGGPVSLLAKPRSLADQLLVNEPAINDILWADLNPSGRKGLHDGVTGLLRLANHLRTRRFGSIVILHHSDRIAQAALLAGITDRRGYGWGLQRLFLNHAPYLPRSILRMHQHTRATRYLNAAGVDLSSAEPHLHVPDALRQQAGERLGITPGSFVAVGIGSSEALRQWGTPRFIPLIAALLQAGWPQIVLVGGPEDAAAAAQITAALGPEMASQIHTAMGWHLGEVAGLLAQSAFYVGNNTGVMNMAAACEVRTYALFGTTIPFDHASQIVPITVPDTGVHDGMVRLTVSAVLDALRTDRGTLSP